ncbi:MAG TPA: hypothetical protein VIF09_16440, partial [Polyangiaceae bacterium]
YSRLLVGYRGTFATAQVISLLDGLAGRDMDHALYLQRIFGAATVPLVFAVARGLQRASPALLPSLATTGAPSLAFPAFAAGLLAVSPVHILFSASDALGVFSGLLAALSYACLLQKSRVWLLAGLLGLGLLTQVRYEDALFVLPAVALFAVRRRWAMASLATLAGVLYLPASLAAGLSYEHHARFAETARWLFTDRALLAPMLGLPLLLAGALLTGLRRRVARLLLSVSPFVALVLLAGVTAERPHDVARVAVNLLVPMVLAAGHGFALLADGGHLGRLAALAVALFAASRPYALREPLHARYLEIAEHDAFLSLLSSAPPGVEAVIVPDDEAMHRAEHATIETLARYRFVRRAAGPHPPPLEGLTRFLDHPSGWCPPGACLFFRGLPCLVEGVDRHVGAQCEALAARDLLEPVASVHVVGAPFLDCSIASGEARRRDCDPTVRPLDFTLLRIR